jgi:hypothetical protein
LVLGYDSALALIASNSALVVAAGDPISAAARMTFVLRHCLLPQPGGFEGL